MVEVKLTLTCLSLLRGGRCAPSRESASYQHFGTFLVEFHHLDSGVVVARFLSQVLYVAVLPAWVHLFLQRSNSTDQPVGDHANISQAEIFQLANS
jgi:hypothetical protein